MTERPPLDLTWLDHMADGLVLVASRRVWHLNRAAATFLEVEPKHALGLPLIAVVRDHRLEQAYLTGRGLELETRGRFLAARPFPGGLVLHDLTESRRAQENARELLAVLSHELRTPVTTIRSTLEALGYDLPEAQRRRFLERAVGETERLVRLLNDLTVDVKPPQLRQVALRETVARATALLQDTFSEHDVRVKADVPALTVWADSDKLLQILINLLENAAVHGPDHKTVRLCATPDPQDNAWVRVAVQDEGEPLPAEAIEPLFEPHTRRTSAGVRGAGLGLYIVRSIAQRWGGHAWGRPLKHGNEFGFSVPLR